MEHVKVEKLPVVPQRMEMQIGGINEKSPEIFYRIYSFQPDSDLAPGSTLVFKYIHKNKL